MAETTSSSATGQARQELILTRILGAPRSLVFRVWTDPERRAPRRPHAHRHARTAWHDLSHEGRFSGNRRARAPGLHEHRSGGRDRQTFARDPQLTLYARLITKNFPSQHLHRSIQRTSGTALVRRVLSSGKEKGA
jgi:hypothetical protein